MTGSALTLATTDLKGPHVDFAALSPLIALLGGATIVLLVGPARAPRWIRAHVVPALSLVALGAARGADDLAVGRGEVDRFRCAADRRLGA